MSDRFRFRLQQVLDHRARREDLARQELAQAMKAVAAQQMRSVTADRAVLAGLAALRELMGGPAALDALRGAHEELASARRRAGHERVMTDRLAAVADERRADLVAAGQAREAFARLRERALQLHRVEESGPDGVAMDELAMRRARRPRAGAAA